MQKTTADKATPEEGQPRKTTSRDTPRIAPPTEPLLRPGENVWRAPRAGRAAVLVDAASYFAALRDAMIGARRAIYIIGWDVDSRTPLVGAEGAAADGLPRELGPFLSALAERRPELQIKILLWDYSLFFTGEREAMPAFALRWRMPPQIDLCLDDAIPLGSSHHQKLVVIDERLAFCGGLDLTIRRWDDSGHAPGNPLRVDPAGQPYQPFHDIQMMVDGEAARALADLARERWERAACETLPRLGSAAADADRWPDSVAPDFHDVAVGIARTQPPYSDHDGAREVETLFHDMVAQARHTIYIESQYLACGSFARALAAAMRRHPRLEAVLVCPRSYHGALERTVMLSGRARFMRALRKAGVASRVLIAAPCVRHGDARVDVSVHAKLMIVDDRYLRVGSANLCNRSMGADTECDLTIAAEDSAEARDTIAGLRNRLIAEHCGAAVEEVERMLARTGSLIATVKALPRRAHYLHAINHDSDDPAALHAPALAAVADPETPIDPTQLIGQGRALGRSRRRTLLGVAGIVLVMGLLVALSLAWTMTPLAEWTDLARWESWLSGLSGPWTIVAVIGVFVLAGLAVFPVTVTIAATAAIFGLWPGFLYAGAGVLASALTTYGLGRWLGPKSLRQVFGPRVNFLVRSFARRGIPAVTLVRIVPVAPFSLINLAAGAIRIPVLHYTIGTVLGLAPGLGLMSLLGDNLTELLRNPSPGGVAIVLGVIAGTVAISVAAQALVTRRRGRRRRGGERAATEAPP